MPPTTKHRIFTVPVANVYPYYVAKAEKKGRTKAGGAEGVMPFYVTKFGPLSA